MNGRDEPVRPAAILACAAATVSLAASCAALVAEALLLGWLTGRWW